ncbi:DUF924 family protein [Niveibacterium sp.]|uniref:DUF924 family protein n=1 Tax=Niveibacterium sp. TaxID=2017444 RepID=UPI0035AEF6F8
MTEWQPLLDFWFLPRGAAGHGAPRAEWFRKSDAFDREIADRFGDCIARALAGGLREWDARPEGALARIVLLDQFTRNVYRDTPQAFAGDALAFALAGEMLARGDDQRLLPVQRVFVYLPFEHAEDAQAQTRSVELFERLASAWPAGASYLDYARRHREVIDRFGRFPHRNSLLGRASSAEELLFLAQPGSHF